LNRLLGHPVSIQSCVSAKAARASFPGALKRGWSGCASLGRIAAYGLPRQRAATSRSRPLPQDPYRYRRLEVNVAHIREEPFYRRQVRPNGISLN
jgi:hypothetical protein